MAATKTSNVNVRIEENIKIQAEKILETIGIPKSVAIDLFYRQIILNNGIPFSIKIPNNVPVRENMTDAEFNILMSRGYLQALEGKYHDAEQVFKELEKGL